MCIEVQKNNEKSFDVNPFNQSTILQRFERVPQINFHQHGHSQNKGLGHQ